MDNANEQDDGDCENLVYEDHPDHFVNDLDNIESKDVADTHYKRIELYGEDEIKHISLALDQQQRMVLDIGVDFARSVVKNKEGKFPVQKAPLLVVQGGAGTGKSTLIDAMSQQMEKIF